MKITSQTIVRTIKYRREIVCLYKTLADKKFKSNRHHGRHLLWLRAMKEGLFTPNSTVPMLVKILNKHYSMIRNNFSEPAISAMSVGRGIQVYQHDELTSLKIYLGTSSPNSKEGELYLSLWKDDERIFRIGFVIVDEDSIFPGNETAILITHIQGSKDKRDLVREIIKNLYDISLDRILFSSLIGFASYLGIKRIYGIPYHYQYTFLSRNKTSHTRQFEENYNAFFSRFQHEIEHNYFSIALPLESKPLETVKHKKRTETRRKFNLHIGDSVNTGLSRINL